MTERRRNPGRRKSDKIKPMLVQAVIFLLSAYVALVGTLLVKSWIN